MRDYMRVSEAVKFAKSFNMSVSRQHIYWAMQNDVLTDHSHVVLGLVKLVKRDEFIKFILTLKKFR